VCRRSWKRIAGSKAGSEFSSAALFIAAAFAAFRIGRKTWRVKLLLVMN
jgi:hypothetical protein